MRSVIGIAAAICVTQAAAFDWENAKAIASEQLFEAYENSAFAQLPMTRADVRQQKLSKFEGREIAPLSKEHRRNYQQSHHNMMGQRKRLGLAKVGVAAGPTVEQQYDALATLSGWILGFATGLTYNQDGEGICYSAIESFIISLDTSTDILKKIYIPAYLPEAQVAIQDFTAISAALYVDCALDKLFNMLIHLASQEGITEISGRLAGDYLFGIQQFLDVRAEPENYSTQERGRIYGKTVSTALNYYI